MTRQEQARPLVTLECYEAGVTIPQITTTNVFSVDIYSNQTVKWTAPGTDIVWNDLPEGKLPEGSPGRLIGAFVRFVALPGTTVWTQLQDSKIVAEYLKFRLEVGGFRVFDLPGHMLAPASMASSFGTENDFETDGEHGYPFVGYRATKEAPFHAFDIGANLQVAGRLHSGGARVQGVTTGDVECIAGINVLLQRRVAQVG